MMGEHLFTLLLQRTAQGSFNGGSRKSLDVGRDAACGEEKVWSWGSSPRLLLLGGFTSLSHAAPSGRVPAHALCNEHQENTEHCARTPDANFLQVQLGHPRGGGDAGLQGRRGREAKAKAAANTGADPCWAKGLKGSQSGSRGCCQSRSSLQSYPCHFQKSRSHCAAQMWCSLCQSLEDRVRTGISRVRRPGQRS